MRKVRNYIFLRDVLVLALTAFGGPQAHIAMFLDIMVNKRKYLTEEELIELNALCQILPGPTSTQTITAIGFQRGGANLAYLTLLVWVFPAVTIMTIAGITILTLQTNNISTEFTKFIQPMAVGFVAYAAFKISVKVIKSSLGVVIMIISALVSFFFRSPYIFPFLLILGGLATAHRYKQQPKEEKEGIHIQWANLILWAGVFVFVAGLGGLTKSNPDLLPIRLFENFYRNGSLIFGGGQVLIPLLYTEFVELKDYLSSSEFLSGFAIVQAIPGPVFSFSAFMGALANRDAGMLGIVLAGYISAIGIFLPGTFLIFFIIRFWDELKKYRIVRASLEGINSASSGMVVAAAIFMYQPLDGGWLDIAIIVITFLLLTFTKTPAPIIILIGLISGFVF